MAATGRRRRFDEPISLSGGRELVTLRDGGNYITKLPKAEHEAPEWQAAMEALILVATHGGPTMLSRINPMLLHMQQAPRCGAKTRTGSPCQSPAMRNGRCRMHGGRSPGAPKGNQNALKHGRYSAASVAERRRLAELIDAMREICNEI